MPFAWSGVALWPRWRCDGAGDECELARPEHVEADHRHEGVRAALGHRNPARQAEFFGDLGQQRAGDLAHVEHALREACGQIAEPDLLVEIERPAAFGPVVVPPDAVLLMLATHSPVSR